LETNEQLSEQYRLRFDEMAEYRDQVWKVLTRDFFQRYVKQADAVLDLGSGWGEFIRNIKAGKKLAMDLNPDSKGRAGPGVEFLLQDCSAPWGVAPSSLDVVFTSNFFEHLPNKDALHRTLKQAATAIKPGGYLICMGPNIRFLAESYWDFWDHHIAISDRSLAEGLALAGFEIESNTARFLPFSMSQGFRPPVVMVSIYLKMPWCWRFFGKQFLVVARKPR
jgi:SAM-dependent methyltransferase